MKQFTLIAAAVMAAAMVVPAAPALAAGEASVTWSVAPATADGPDGRAWVEQKIAPGDSVTEHLAVRNLGKTATTFALSAADGYFTKTGRFNMLQADQQSVAAGTWISVVDDVLIEPGATAVIPFTISVPANATPGDHAAGVAASITSSGTTEDGAQIGVNSRVGFRVMTQVTGDLAPALTVTDLDADYSPSWNLFSPGTVDVSYAAQNTGNTQLTFGESVDGVSTPRGDLFPGDSRTVATEPIRTWPLGPITMEVAVESTVPSDGSLAVAPVTRSVVVWAIPWLHLAVLLGVAIVITMLVLGRRRNSAKLERLLDEARAEGRQEVMSS
ncbi:hypothetical protein EYE40_13315 [Glaciihabitans arcticus]|uniref:DUF916 domain-containing protein n=1 Tax=Glaciihabitans arcticus TaxID=2668039 RepID=A0A4Q9GZP3_9MICO|nr:hypothetical protein [Glaciihabitans arcticus]TBN58293.1 hypothetical protein EYE40_13315 [Glaciihabitans arcticus]